MIEYLYLAGSNNICVKETVYSSIINKLMVLDLSDWLNMGTFFSYNTIKK